MLYRLNGDDNPLHIDPAVAAKGNFPRPILHGLCSYGFSARAVYDKFGGADPTRVKKVATRFTSHVFPGETLIVDMWKSGDRVYYETKTKERGLVVIKGIMELEGQVAKL